jgi:hypothetical protein
VVPWTIRERQLLPQGRLSPFITEIFPVQFTTFISLAALATAALAGASQAQEEAPVRFKKPVRIMAGEGHLGAEMYYPSPRVHDVNGDGVMDIVLGDLFGSVTLACGKKTDTGVMLEKAVPLKGQDGKALKFENW